MMTPIGGDVRETVLTAADQFTLIDVITAPDAYPPITMFEGRLPY